MRRIIILFFTITIINLCSYCYAQEANNSIAGTITIPEGQKGTLFIKVRNFMTAKTIKMEIIEKKDIKDINVEYQIDNIPDGEYDIEAFLDVAEPFHESTDDPRWICAWEGDYVRAYKESFKLEKGIHKDNIDVELKLLKKGGKLE